MKEIKIKRIRHNRRTQRTRKIIQAVGVKSSRPRLSVFRSNKNMYVQVIDDTKKVTLIAAHEKELENDQKMTKVQRAELLGALLAKKALGKKISKVVFDKGSYRYHGRVKSFADGARKEGLSF